MAQDDIPRQPVFQGDFFEAQSLEHAKQLTVTSETGMSSQVRWALETPYLVNDISKFLPIQPESWVLDYGCGTGRVSKGLLERHGCHIIGIDAAKAMRLLAPEFVLSERFLTWSPETLDTMIEKGFRADFCVSVWVLQHAYDPMDLIVRIDRALKPGGLFYSLNGKSRCVPTDLGWANDRFDMRAALADVFAEEHCSALPLAVAPPHLAEISMIQVLRKKSNR